MRKFVLAMSAVGALAMAQPASAGTVESGIGNTVIIIDNGVTTRWQLAGDGRYTMLAENGERVVGAWRQAPNQICVTPDGGSEVCFPLTEGKSVGDTWQQDGPSGQPITVTIQAGT